MTKNTTPNKNINENEPKKVNLSSSPVYINSGLGNEAYKNTIGMVNDGGRAFYATAGIPKSNQLLYNSHGFDGTFINSDISDVFKSGIMPSYADGVSLATRTYSSSTPFEDTLLRVGSTKTDTSLTKEEIERLIDKKLPSEKEAGLKKEEAVGLFEELIESRNKKEIENISATNNLGLEFITKELLQGKETSWHCGKCRTPLEVFKGEESIDKIKRYLTSFSNNIFKKCKNGHKNWFEITNDGITWSVSVIFSKQFDKKS